LIKLFRFRLLLVLHGSWRYLHDIQTKLLPNIIDSSSTINQQTGLSVGLVVKKYWNKLLYLFTILQQQKIRPDGLERVDLNLSINHLFFIFRFILNDLNLILLPKNIVKQSKHPLVLVLHVLNFNNIFVIIAIVSLIFVISIIYHHLLPIIDVQHQSFRNGYHPMISINGLIVKQKISIVYLNILNI
jgi:hypothetical protein